MQVLRNIMNRFSLLFVLAASAIFSISCSSDQNETSTDTSAQDISIILDDTWDALADQDPEAFNNHITPDWQLYTAGGNKVDAEALISNHRQNMTDFNLDRSNLDIEIRYPMAWATYDAHMSGLWQGEDWGGDFIMTNIFVHDRGHWKIAHMHESRAQ